MRGPAPSRAAPALGSLADLGGGARARTLADRAFAALHEAILIGRLEPGRRMPIEELADALGMSPMPVREALRRLDAVGLIEQVPHRGARVTGLSVEDVRDIYRARLALEPLAVRRAAERLTPADAEHVQATFDALRRVARRTGPRTWPAHTDFHFALYHAAGSRWLDRLITPLWESAERYRIAAGAAKGGLDIRQDEHAAIMAAVLEGRGEDAARLLRDHLATTANDLATRLGTDGLFAVAAAPRRAPAVR